MQLYDRSMRRTSFRNWPCSIARTVDLIGDWWTPLVLREAFLGSRRFEEMQSALGIGRNVLTERLGRLVDEGLLERRQYQERPARYEYLLTEKGADFIGVITALMRWGDRWLDRGRGAPIALRHKTCGERTHAEVVCAHCKQPLAHGDLMVELGPGFPKSREAASALKKRIERRAAREAGAAG